MFENHTRQKILLTVSSWACHHSGITFSSQFSQLFHGLTYSFSLLSSTTEKPLFFVIRTNSSWDVHSKMRTEARVFSQQEVSARFSERSYEVRSADRSKEKRLFRFARNFSAHSSEDSCPWFRVNSEIVINSFFHIAQKCWWKVKTANTNVFTFQYNDFENWNV